MEHNDKCSLLVGPFQLRSGKFLKYFVLISTLVTLNFDINYDDSFTLQSDYLSLDKIYFSTPRTVRNFSFHPKNYETQLGFYLIIGVGNVMRN